MTGAGRARAAQTQLRVGRLTKAHGLKGGIKLELFTDDPDRRFTPGASFSLQVPEESPWHGRRIELTELRWYNSHPVGFFSGVADRTAAESLIKAILWIDQDPDEVDEPDAWYDHQLVGLEVVREGERVGVIDRLEHLPAQDLLVVKVDDREVLVPFVRAIVPEVDLGRRRVVVTPPEGLFEVAADDDADRVAEAVDGPGGRTDGAEADDATTATMDDGTVSDATPDGTVADDAASEGAASADAVVAEAATDAGARPSGDADPADEARGAAD